MMFNNSESLLDDGRSGYVFAFLDRRILTARSWCLYVAFIPA